MVTVSRPAADWLPATSQRWASRVRVPSARKVSQPAGQKWKAQLLLAPSIRWVITPPVSELWIWAAHKGSLLVPARSITWLLVMSSVLLRPLSCVASRSNTGAAGATVSMVTTSAADGALGVPLGAYCCA